MLMPLETLPGWPAAPDPSILQALGLLIGAPLVLGLLIAAGTYLSATRELNRFGPPVNPARAYAGEQSLQGGEGAAAIEAPAADAGTGGTSARW